MGRASRLKFQSREQRQGSLPPGILGIGGGQPIDTRPAVLLDGYGRALQVGDGVVLTLPRPPIFRVQSVQPVPGPQGLMDIRVRCELRFIAPRAEMQPEFLLAMVPEEMAEIFKIPVPMETPTEEPAEDDGPRPIDVEGDGRE